MRRKSIDDWARELMIPLYRERYTETLWNTLNSERREKGWELKGGMWSPWFFNMRPVGSSPGLFTNLNYAMSDLMLDHPDIDMFIAVDMAGINASGGMAVASMMREMVERSIGYSRPLPIKVRKPMEALALLDQMDAGLLDNGPENFTEAMAILKEVYTLTADETRKQEIGEALSLLGAVYLTDSEKYGEKEFVEGRILDGMRLAIFDDMATNIGSKIIIRLVVLRHALKKGIKGVTCNKIFYYLNRDPLNKQRGLDFANEKEAGLFPAPLEVYYIIEFEERLPDLRRVMKEAEYDTIRQFQKNFAHFQDEDVQKEVLALAARTR